jgi:hypothetical protein
MKLLLLSKSTGYEDVITLVRALETYFEIEVDDIDGVHCILTLFTHEKASPEKGEAEDRPP